MNTRTLITIIPAAALLLLAACTQDEPGGQGNELPYGEYPLQIGGVTFDVESSAEPWSAEGPQTRVTEDNTDGKSSVWEWNDSEMIGVRLGNETATYTLNADKTLISDNQLYWTSTAPAPVTAWYPANETVNLSDQSKGLAYVLQAEVPGATYDNEITLEFTHQLAKVRVVLNGTQASLAQSVEVYGYTSCRNNEGAPVTDNAQQGWLKMKHTTYTDGTECWEANVVPGTIDKNSFLRLNGHAVLTESELSGFSYSTLEAAKMYTIDLTVGEEITEITAENNSPINDDGYYRVSGTFNHQISITDGSPTIYLENANISAPTPIRITGNSTATIHVTGGNSAVTSTSGTGILVEKGSTLIITSENTDNVITVRGKFNSPNGYPGIGGNESGDCGTIHIKNVTVHAYGDASSGCAPGIGPSQNCSCEGIIIEDAVVYAYGTGNDDLAAPGIGSGMHNFSVEIGAIPKIEITHSTIHAVRGGVVADYIGRAGWTFDSASSEVNPGTGGSIKSSTVYCHTRDTDRLDKTMVYDASGNATQQ